MNTKKNIHTINKDVQPTSEPRVKVEVVRPAKVDVSRSKDIIVKVDLDPAERAAIAERVARSIREETERVVGESKVPTYDQSKLTRFREVAENNSKNLEEGKYLEAQRELADLAYEPIEHVPHPGGPNTEVVDDRFIMPNPEDGSFVESLEPYDKGKTWGFDPVDMKFDEAEGRWIERLENEGGITSDDVGKKQKELYDGYGENTGEDSVMAPNPLANDAGIIDEDVPPVTPDESAEDKSVEEVDDAGVEEVTPTEEGEADEEEEPADEEEQVEDEES